ncbi:hypothetical protein PIB30_098391, partial [Stylosanthes scabra]|nr:hypothetical protein [Stylosanthes scabra]
TWSWQEPCLAHQVREAKRGMGRARLAKTCVGEGLVKVWARLGVSFEAMERAK